MERKGRPRISKRQEERILIAFKKHPEWSLRRIAEKAGNVSYGTVLNVLKEHRLWVGK